MSNNDRTNLYAALFVAVIMIAGITFSIWLHFFASCSSVDWMPTKEMPGRCLPGGRG